MGAINSNKTCLTSTPVFSVAFPTSSSASLSPSSLATKEVSTKPRSTNENATSVTVVVGDQTSSTTLANNSVPNTDTVLMKSWMVSLSASVLNALFANTTTK